MVVSCRNSLISPWRVEISQQVSIIISVFHLHMSNRQNAVNWVTWWRYQTPYPRERPFHPSELQMLGQSTGCPFVWYISPHFSLCHGHRCCHGYHYKTGRRFDRKTEQTDDFINPYPKIRLFSVIQLFRPLKVSVLQLSEELNLIVFTFRWLALKKLD